MSRFPSGPHLAVCLTLVLSVVCGVVQADRLHLDSGGQVDVEKWWVEGDFLFYDSDGGTVGIPRGSVVRIESRAVPARSAPFATSSGESKRKDRPTDLEELRAILDEGEQAIHGGDYETAANLFHRALQIQPALYGARVAYAVSEIALGHDGSALAAVLDGLERRPDGAQLHELLGDLRDREENLEEALRSWRHAFELDPTDRVREKILKAERDQQSRAGYQFARSSHFNVRYDGEVDADLAASVMEFLEAQYWELSDEYKHAPTQPITVLLYPNREFREVTQAAEWVGGLYDGKIRVPLGGLARLDERARRVLRHELTHAVVHSKSRGHAPRWLHEGLAQVAEGRRLSDGDLDGVREQLSQIDPTEWDKDGFSYALALSLTSFLQQERGFDDLVYLVQLLGEGVEEDEALTRIYGEDYVSICRRWADRVRRGQTG